MMMQQLYKSVCGVCVCVCVCGVVCGVCVVCVCVRERKCMRAWSRTTVHKYKYNEIT